MWIREHKGTLAVIGLGAVALTIHLGLGTWALAALSRWASGIVVGLVVAVVLGLHVVGLRRLAARRRAAEARPKTTRMGATTEGESTP